MTNYRCPKCGQSEKFRVTGVIPVIWYVDGIGDSNGYEEDDNGPDVWDNSSPCRCPECGHQATVGVFEVQPEAKP